ncbi:GNAT family N-acetyltransferase [Rothia nasimurium]|uniref:GNAT family N-acetyltransferase n=1 Tax=Rothia nasimurium TaxID=85336 RepID=UPI00162AA3A7|nr:GNAT family N-acetyltransferase [Rothia nasimurium]
MPDLILRPLALSDCEQATRAHQLLLERDNFDFLQGDPVDFPAVLEKHSRLASGEDMPEGYVRSELLVAEYEGRTVGRTSIRYELTDFLMVVGGHVGYAVLPDERRQGFAGKILRLSLNRLRAAGVCKVLVTCDESNLASRRTIEGAGGVLENTHTTSDGKVKLRFWIDNSNV